MAVIFQDKTKKRLIRKGLLATIAAAAVFISAAVCFAADVSAENENSGKVNFTYSINDDKLTVNIRDYDENLRYGLSINGGKTYIPLFNKPSLCLSSLPSGTYQLCVVKYLGSSSIISEKTAEISDIQAAAIGKSGINEDYEIKLRVSGIRENTFLGGGVSICITNYSPKMRYMLSVDGGKCWRAVSGMTTRIDGLCYGRCTVMVKNADDPRYRSVPVSVTVPSKLPAGRAVLKAPLIRQLPELPTGCEITSLAMAINYYGIKIKKTALADSFLEKGEYRQSDFRKVFVGNPREQKAYGCYADVIVNSAHKYLSTIKTRSFKVINLTGCGPETLYSYIDMGFPVIVWATGRMNPVTEGPTWTDKETGKTITWLGNEHCLLLTGYDLELGYVYMNDPLYGTAAYKTDLFEQRFYDLENQAVVIAEIGG